MMSKSLAMLIRFAALVGLASLLVPASALDSRGDAERLALEARVQAVRAQLDAAAADKIGEDVPPVPHAQWMNWPNWNNWNNWPNWGNWNNWVNWFNR